MGAEGGVVVVRSDTGLPAPAALALFAVGTGHGDLQFIALARLERELRHVEPFA